MEQRKMQQTVGELRKKAIMQTFDRRQLKRYENAGDKTNAERLRGIMADRQKEIETLRKRMNNQRQNNGMSCRWLTTKSKVLAYRGEKHDGK